MKKILTLVALAALTATASASTNLLQDGSFESQTVSSGNWALTSASPWVVTAAGTSTTVGLEVRDNYYGSAENGSNFIELDGNENDQISQSFATVAGATYTVSFWYEDRSGVASSSEGWAASVVGATTLAQAMVSGNSSSVWKEETITFTADSAVSTFSIWATGKSDSFGTSFDNFSVTAAVPEPTTLALFAAGLGMLGMAARRRRQQ